MARQKSLESTAAPETADARKARLRGWFVIGAIALATITLFVLGTIDRGLRYDLIKL